MKNIIKDENAVAYLVLVGIILTLIVSGVCFNFTSDFVDFWIASINGYEGTPLANQIDQDTIDGGDFLMTIFKFCLIPILFCIMYFSWVMGMKPVRSW